MNVILIESVKNKGELGDEISVKEGFARNYLFPRNLAIPATAKNRKRFESLKKKALKELEESKKALEKVAKDLNNKKISVAVKTNKGKLYGSYTPKDFISDVEKEFKASLKRNQISIPDHIKEVGEYRDTPYCSETATGIERLARTPRFCELPSDQVTFQVCC